MMWLPGHLGTCKWSVDPLCPVTFVIKRQSVSQADKKSDAVFSNIDTIDECGRQTDREPTTASTELCTVSRGKKTQTVFGSMDGIHGNWSGLPVIWAQMNKKLS